MKCPPKPERITERSTLDFKINRLLTGSTILLPKNKLGWISERTQDRLFNALHRDHGAHRMDIKKATDNRLSIRVIDASGAVIVDSFILLS